MRSWWTGGDAELASGSANNKQASRVRLKPDPQKTDRQDLVIAVTPRLVTSAVTTADRGGSGEFSIFARRLRRQALARERCRRPSACSLRERARGRRGSGAS